MGYKERVEMYKVLQAKRDRPLIVYVTSSRFNASGQMSGDMIPELLDQLMTIPKEHKKVDFLVVSNGGDPTVAWRIISLLRERFEHVSVLIPQAAFSAATLLAMGANEIVMHPNGNLGPTDPQLQVVKTNDRGVAEPTKFAAEDIRGFLKFIREEVGITDQAHLKDLFSGLCNEVGYVPIGSASRAVALSSALGRRLLALHMKEPGLERKIDLIVDALNTQYFMHGYPVSRREAKDLGLPVALPIDEEVEKLMWAIWIDIEKELKIRIPFFPLHCLLQDPEAAELLRLNTSRAPGQANQLPSQPAQAPTAVVACERISAIIESEKLASHFKVISTIYGGRQQGLQVHVNMMDTEFHWFHIDPSKI